MTFFDTSIFVAAAQASHLRHRPSADLLRQATRLNSACATHSLAETYNVLSGVPPPQRLAPMHAVEILRQMRQRVRLVSLTDVEYLSTIESLAAKGLSGGMVYDGLIARCARKAGATRIYTWNIRHFKIVDEELAAIVYTP